jgi:hypothetical protein
MSVDPNKRARIFNDDEDRLHHKDESDGLSRGWYRHDGELPPDPDDEDDGEDEHDRIGT